MKKIFLSLLLLFTISFLQGCTSNELVKVYSLYDDTCYEFNLEATAYNSINSNYGTVTFESKLSIEEVTSRITDTYTKYNDYNILNINNDQYLLYKSSISNKYILRSDIYYMIGTNACLFINPTYMSDISFFDQELFYEQEYKINCSFETFKQYYINSNVYETISTSNSITLTYQDNYYKDLSKFNEKIEISYNDTYITIKTIK